MEERHGKHASRDHVLDLSIEIAPSIWIHLLSGPLHQSIELRNTAERPGPALLRMEERVREAVWIGVIGTPREEEHVVATRLSSRLPRLSRMRDSTSPQATRSQRIEQRRSE